MCFLCQSSFESFFRSNTIMFELIPSERVKIKYPRNLLPNKVVGESCFYGRNLQVLSRLFSANFLFHQHIASQFAKPFL